MADRDNYPEASPPSTAAAYLAEFLHIDDRAAITSLAMADRDDYQASPPSTAHKRLADFLHDDDDLQASPASISSAMPDFDEYQASRPQTTAYLANVPYQASPASTSALADHDDDQVSPSSISATADLDQASTSSTNILMVGHLEDNGSAQIHWQMQPLPAPKLTEQSSFARDFYNIIGGDAPLDPHNDNNTAPAAAAAVAAIDIADQNNTINSVPFVPLTPKEERSALRVALLTPSQWSIVMDTYGMSLAVGESINEMRLSSLIMEWRRERGDFDQLGRFEDVYEGDGDAEQQLAVPRQLRDDMEGADECNLMQDYLKTDLQVECLLRGIWYEGSDSKASLISKLLYYKDHCCLNTNTFDVLQQESTL